jgi:pyruvate formate lyase activating enzyme
MRLLVSIRGARSLLSDSFHHDSWKFVVTTPFVAARDLLRDRRAALGARTRPGVLFEGTGETLRCTACAHRCVLGEGRSGTCGVRIGHGDHVLVPFGYVARRYVRPIETNTLLHVRPGTTALTFGMYGCDLRCAYCQNWRLSQATRDPEAGGTVIPMRATELVEEAITAGCTAVCAAYNEPLVTAEWAHEIFAEAKRRGLLTAVITDGHATPEVIAYMRPVTDVFRVDLKAYDEQGYRALGGRLAPVLAAIAEAKRLGYWIEIVTLVVPQFNDDARGLRYLAGAIQQIDPNIPWHLNAFQPRYRMADRRSPERGVLWSLAGMAYARGLSFVYVGNVDDDGLHATRCPTCHEVLIERRNWQATRVLLRDGACPTCATQVPGIW